MAKCRSRTWKVKYYSGRCLVIRQLALTSAMTCWKTGALFKNPIRRLIVRSRKVSKPQDLYLELSNRSGIWLAPGQHCQISKRYENFNIRSRTFETLRDLTIRRLIGYWNGTQGSAVIYCASSIYLIARLLNMYDREPDIYRTVQQSSVNFCCSSHLGCKWLKDPFMKLDFVAYDVIKAISELTMHSKWELYGGYWRVIKIKINRLYGSCILLRINWEKDWLSQACLH